MEVKVRSRELVELGSLSPPDVFRDGSKQCFMVVDGTKEGVGTVEAGSKKLCLNLQTGVLGYHDPAVKVEKIELVALEK